MHKFLLVILLFYVSLSLAQNIPQGDIKGPFEWKSDIYPGTIREYLIYVPKQYNQVNPACLMVIQDGLNVPQRWNITNIMDSLIASGDIPVTIGVFVMPGRTFSKDPNLNYPRPNRSVEYDAVDDTYATFLIEEFLPAVTSEYNLIDNSNSRLIGGSSSGGIASFMVAWHRPDYFGRVICGVGSFTNLRGGNIVSSWVRKWEPKPIKVFMQDGSNDLNNFSGSWWWANNEMYTALKWSGYDVKNQWDDTGHGASGLAAVMPDAMKWIWKDYPTPLKVNLADNQNLKIPIDGEGWQEIYKGENPLNHIASNAKGDVYFFDSSNETLNKIDADANISPVKKGFPDSGQFEFDKEGNLWLENLKKKSLDILDQEFKPIRSYPNIELSDLLISNTSIFFTKKNSDGIFSIQAGSGKIRRASNMRGFTTISINAEQTFLLATNPSDKYGYSFSIQEDSLTHAQRWIRFEDHPLLLGSDVNGAVTDSKDRVFFITNFGIQVITQMGRVELILQFPLPDKMTDITFGGPDRNYLYLAAGQSIYRRKLNTTGLMSFEYPVLPPKPPHSRVPEINSFKQ